MLNLFNDFERLWMNKRKTRKQENVKQFFLPDWYLTQNIKIPVCPSGKTYGLISNKAICEPSHLRFLAEPSTAQLSFANGQLKGSLAPIAVSLPTLAQVQTVQPWLESTGTHDFVMNKTMCLAVPPDLVS